MASGMRATMPAKMMREMPLPMPRSVICSPIHMMKAVPAERVMTVMMRKDQPGVVTTRQAGGIAERLEVGGDADALDGGQDHRAVAGVLGDALAPDLALLLHLLQRRDHDGEELQDDGGRDVGHDAQREDGQLLEGSAGEQVEEAEQAALRGHHLAHGDAVDAGRADEDAEAVDRQHPHGEEEPLAQLGDAEDVGETVGEHPGSPCSAYALVLPLAFFSAFCFSPIVWRFGQGLDLAAGLLDGLARAGGHPLDAHGVGPGQVALAEHHHPVALAAGEPGAAEGLARSTTLPAGSRPRSVTRDLLELEPEGLLNPNFGRRRCSGIWPPSKPSKCMLPRAGLLALPAASGGLAEA